MASLRAVPRSGAPDDRMARRSRLGLAICALLVTAAPLAFGAVDRITQLALALLLALGVVICPPVVTRIGRWPNVLIATLLTLVLVKEFAPASLFGATDWRTTLTQSYGVAFPWTHHPEPSRALDALLAAVLAAIWFYWVRTLAAHRDQRVALAWILLGSAAVVAAVSFATRGLDPKAIYGLRFTRGWQGFGPFPNRNHTACLLAMGAVMGAGCVVWAGAKRKYGAAAVAGAMAGLILAALLVTESRGGLVALACGLAVFLGLVMLKLRDRRALGLGLAAALLLGAASLTFGAKLLERFTSADRGLVSNMTRVHIWQDTLGMWKDAPLLGHGLNSFAQLFPMFQTIELDNQTVLHPESSWLLWLAELGALPLAIAAAALLVMLVPHLRESFATHSSFYLRAAAFAAAAALLCHSAIDVPAHRWGTAAFALAALALACPLRRDATVVAVSRNPAIVAAGIGVFWALPLISGAPFWAPLSLTRLLARETTAGDVKLLPMEQTLRAFPLSPDLHQAIGMRQLWTSRPGTTPWAEHFRIAARLTPGSWKLVYEQARATRRFSPGHALHYWQLTVERGGHRREELLQQAVAQTADLPGADTAWASYVEAHPDLLLAIARVAPESAAREYYERWWTTRGVAGGAVSPQEIADFHVFLSRFGNAAQLKQWTALHPERHQTDALAWATLYHGWNEDEQAWALLKAAVPEPAFPAPRRNDRGDGLDHQWRTDPTDLVNALALARARDAEGDAAGSESIILAVAARPGAPTWFVHKGAHVLARRGQLREAVALIVGAKKN